MAFGIGVMGSRGEVAVPASGWMGHAHLGLHSRGGRPWSGDAMGPEGKWANMR